MTQKIKPISQTSKQQHSLDSYGYPFPPGSRQRLRNTTIRTSKSILNAEQSRGFTPQTALSQVDQQHAPVGEDAGQIETIGLAQHQANWCT